MRSNVDKKGVKRTPRGISLVFNKMSPFRANELQGVKPFVMWGISGNFLETFIPLPSRMGAPAQEGGFWAGEQPEGIRNEAGMCPGSNCLVNYAPIADWVKANEHDRGLGRGRCRRSARTSLLRP